jgi:hypothetical protein
MVAGGAGEVSVRVASTGCDWGGEASAASTLGESGVTVADSKGSDGRGSAVAVKAAGLIKP